MNNTFIVEIPRDLKKIKSKLYFGLTKRQLIGFISAGIVAFSTFLLLKDISLDLAMYVSFFLDVPILFCVIYKNKNGLSAEVILKLMIEYHFIYHHKRRFQRTKKNKEIRKRRGIE